jgi:Domain of unknown function (DUF4267)
MMKANPANPWRSAGVWMSALIALLMAINTWRAAPDPEAFARNFGIDAAAGAHPAFIYVYAVRAFFLGLVTAVLIWRREYVALSWFAAVAIVMPLGDVLLVMNAGGTSTIIARHLAIAAYLALTAFLLNRWTKTHD